MKMSLEKCVKTKIETHLEIPHQVNGVPVTKIESNAFFGIKKLVSVKCPDTIDRIGRFAFMHCSNLERFEFYNTATGPSGLLYIESNVFEGCESLKVFKAAFPIRRVESMVFKNCRKLEQVDAFVQVWGHKVFLGCDNLCCVTISDKGSWQVDSFIKAKRLKDFYFVGTVDVNQSCLNVISKKKLHCTPKFNHLDLLYTGTSIKFV